MARSRLPRTVSAGRPCSSILDCSTVCQLPIRTPRRLAPFTRRMPANGGQAHVDRGGSEVVLFQEEAIPEHNGPVEGQSWFRAAPADEFVDRMAIGFLRTRSR